MPFSLGEVQSASVAWMAAASAARVVRSRIDALMLADDDALSIDYCLSRLTIVWVSAVNNCSGLAIVWVSAVHNCSELIH